MKTNSILAVLNPRDQKMEPLAQPDAEVLADFLSRPEGKALLARFCALEREVVRIRRLYDASDRGSKPAPPHHPGLGKDFCADCGQPVDQCPRPGSHIVGVVGDGYPPCQ